jgi:transposase
VRISGSIVAVQQAKWRQKFGLAKEPAEKVTQDVACCGKNSQPKIKIYIVPQGLRGEESIHEVCQREGIVVENLYYRWSKEFLEACKKRITGDRAREASSDDVKDVRREASALKQVVAELTIENGLLKKCVSGDGRSNRGKRLRKEDEG